MNTLLWFWLAACSWWFTWTRSNSSWIGSTIARCGDCTAVCTTNQLYLRCNGDLLPLSPLVQRWYPQQWRFFDQEGIDCRLWNETAIHAVSIRFQKSWSPSSASCWDYCTVCICLLDITSFIIPNESLLMIKILAYPPSARQIYDREIGQRWTWRLQASDW